MTTRVTATLAMIAILCLSALGAGGSPAQAQEKTEVVVWVFSTSVYTSEPFLSWYDIVTEQFERENPGATLRFENADSQKLLTATVAGTPPDVGLLNTSTLYDFHEAGLLMPLNTYVESTPHMAREEFFPTSVVLGEKDGIIFGYPYSFAAYNLMYNRQHLIEAGLDHRPEVFQSWDDLSDYAQRLTQQSPSGDITRSGLILPTSLGYFASYLFANGGDFYNADGTGVAFNNSKGAEVLEMMRRFTSELNVAPQGASWYGISDLTASMVVGNTSGVPLFHAQGPEDYATWLEMAPFPAGPQGAHSASSGYGNQWVIPTGAANPDLAWNFIKMWLDAEMSVQRFVHWGSSYVNSARLDFLTSAAFRDALDDYPYLMTTHETFNNARPFPQEKWGEINRRIQPLFAQVARGEMSPESALAEAERLANDALKQ